MNGESFDTVVEAKLVIKRWRREYNQVRPHSTLGYRPPEEFEHQTQSSSQAESRGATMQFFENDENSINPAGVSEVMIGEGDSIAVPFPEPHPLLEHRRTLSTNAEAVNRKIVPS